MCWNYLSEFKPVLWNHFNTDVRTINGVEGFHSNVNKGIRKHQTIFLLINFIKKLHSSTLVDYERIKQQQVVKTQNKKDKEKDLRIENLKKAFRNDRTNLEDYFETISLQIQFPYDRLGNSN